MRSEDFPEFRTLMEGLCAAFDRQCTDAKVKAFYESLKHVHIADLKRSAASWKANFAKMPTPKDLMPQRSAAAPKPVDDSPHMSRWSVAANKILFALAYLDKRRGFVPINSYTSSPPEGWRMPLIWSKANVVEGFLLKRMLEIKRDYVEMAEDAARIGQPMDDQEFQAMCREGFERALGIANEQPA